MMGEKKRTARHIKQDWVIDWIDRHGPMNILDIEFVDAFTEKFNVPYRIQPFGANSCPSLGRLLGNMYRYNLLDRSIIGLSEGLGWPKWVYVYTIRQADKMQAAVKAARE